MLSSAKCLCVKFICFGFPNDCSILGLLELRHQIILSDRPTGCPQTRIQKKSLKIKPIGIKFISISKYNSHFPPIFCVRWPSIRNPLPARHCWVLPSPELHCPGLAGNINYKTYTGYGQPTSEYYSSNNARQTCLSRNL